MSNQLAAELRRLDEELTLCSQLKREYQEQAATAMVECEQLRADAARYRWLVARPLNGDDEFYISAQDSNQANADGWWALGGDMSKSEADAYIDAAIKETK
jgi:multidrug resistance efflux pump